MEYKGSNDHIVPNAVGGYLREGLQWHHILAEIVKLILVVVTAQGFINESKPNESTA